MSIFSKTLEKRKDVFNKGEKILTKGKKGDTSEMDAEVLRETLGKFKSQLFNGNKLKNLDIVMGIKLDDDNVVKADNSSTHRIDVLFKETVAKNTKVFRGSLFSGFRIWSDSVFSKLKQATVP